MTNTSVTLQETGIAEAIDGGGRYESARNKMMALDFATQLQEMKAIAGQPDYALGSVHAITRDGTLVIASASGSQLASYAWGAPTSSSSSARRSSSTAWKRRMSGSSSTACRSKTPARMPPTAEQPRRQDPRDPPGGPGRIHVVLIRQSVGF